MPFVRGFLRIVTHDRHGRPIDPGYGVEEGGEPGQGLPEGPPGFWGGEGHYPGQGLPGEGHHPGQGLPDRPAFGRPGQGLPKPPWEGPAWPPSPVDPDWGVDGGVGAGHLPSLPPFIPDHGFNPDAPDQGLPEIPGAPEHPSQGLPPGTVWPPLPPSAPVGKAALLCYISGVGFRYIVVTIPDRPERPEHPSQGLPGAGGRPATLPGR